MDELLKQLPDLFSRAHPLAQLGVLAALIFGAAYFAYRSLTKGLRLKKMRAERDQARGQVGVQERLVLELQTKLTDSEALSQQRHQEVQRLTQDHGRLLRDLDCARREVQAATDQL